MGEVMTELEHLQAKLVQEVATIAHGAEANPGAHVNERGVIGAAMTALHFSALAGLGRAAEADVARFAGEVRRLVDLLLADGRKAEAATLHALLGRAFPEDGP